MRFFEQPTMCPIVDIVQETENVKTFFFDIALNSKPGQFVIMWIPRVDEKPFSIAYDEHGRLGLSVAKVGRFTEKLFEYKKGGLVGIRGPYGSAFTLQDGLKRILFVGGGYGVAPLATLASQAIARGITVDFCNGARTKSLLLFMDRLEALGISLHVATDDGSEGHRGFITDVVKELLEANSYDCVYTCGPELMEQKVVDVAAEKNIVSQVSIERYMKCGFGICGACCIDDSGKRMCIEGPVVSGEFARTQSEFGRFHRIASGHKVSFNAH
ncbi:MAG: dihydroorotate dehydrogenase electron transfer subunit [Parcubacteria group bacterium]